MAAVKPRGITPKQFTDVPRHTRLQRRKGGMYYMRAKVPPALRTLVGKAEIVVSLKTRDPREAIKLVKIESLKADQKISEAEAKLRGRPRDIETSDEALRWMAQKAFVEFETESLQHDTKLLPQLDEQERDEIILGRKEEYAVLIGSKHYAPEDTAGYQRTMAEKVAEKFGIVPGTPLFERAFPLFVEVALENFRRNIDRARDRQPYRISFKELDATSTLPPTPLPRMTLGRLLDDFMTYQREAHTVGTVAAYGTSVKVLRQRLGNDRPLMDITKRDIETVFKFLATVPVNAEQRYPGLSLEAAVERANRENDTRRLAPRSVKNYLVHFVAIFNYAIEYGYIRNNPADSRILGEAIKTGQRPKRKTLFTDEQLNMLFLAPLYTGCVDDERRYMISGSNLPRRGRFWVPLLALYQGFRCNEACQLHTADVGVEAGVPFIEIRADSNGAVTEKRLKTRSSERKVPVHPELLRIGFMRFVEQRRADTKSPRLFPELKFHEGKQSYSHDFSKWFGEFVKGECGSTVKATLHSFRHHFRRALSDGGVAIELVEALGGWSSKGSSEIEYRHTTLPMLLKAMKRVRYPIDLTHLREKTAI